MDDPAFVSRDKEDKSFMPTGKREAWVSKLLISVSASTALVSFAVAGGGGGGGCGDGCRSDVELGTAASSDFAAAGSGALPVRATTATSDASGGAARSEKALVSGVAAVSFTTFVVGNTFGCATAASAADRAGSRGRWFATAGVPVTTADFAAINCDGIVSAAPAAVRGLDGPDGNGFTSVTVAAAAAREVDAPNGDEFMSVTATTSAAAVGEVDAPDGVVAAVSALTRGASDSGSGDATEDVFAAAATVAKAGGVVAAATGASLICNRLVRAMDWRNWTHRFTNDIACSSSVSSRRTVQEDRCTAVVRR
jgi:hypothetical protein